MSETVDSKLFLTIKKKKKEEEEEEATGEHSTIVVGFLFFIVFLRDSQKVSKLLLKPSVSNPKDANPKLASMHCIM